MTKVKEAPNGNDILSLGIFDDIWICWRSLDRIRYVLIILICTSKDFRRPWVSRPLRRCSCQRRATSNKCKEKWQSGASFSWAAKPRDVKKLCSVVMCCSMMFHVVPVRIASCACYSSYLLSRFLASLCEMNIIIHVTSCCNNDIPQDAIQDMHDGTW